MPRAKGKDKKPIALKVAPPVLVMVDKLVVWLNAPSKAWVWESAIIRWHAVEQARQRNESPMQPAQSAQAPTASTQAEVEQQIQSFHDLLAETAQALADHLGRKDIAKETVHLAGELVALGIQADLDLDELRLALELAKQLADEIAKGAHEEQ